MTSLMELVLALMLELSEVLLEEDEFLDLKYGLNCHQS